MKIDDIYQGMNVIGQSGESAANKKTEAQEETLQQLDKRDPSGTEVEISHASVEISKVAEMMEKEQPERVARVNEIKTKVEDGTYKVDAEKIAAKILEEVS
jgi:negative regulator of flagellin synthesis FlgM